MGDSDDVSLCPIPWRPLRIFFPKTSHQRGQAREAGGSAGLRGGVWGRGGAVGGAPLLRPLLINQHVSIVCPNVVRLCSNLGDPGRGSPESPDNP